MRIKTSSIAGILLSGLACVFSVLTEARQLDVPVRLEEGFLQRLLMEQIYTDNNREAHIWDDGRDCNFLTLTAPELKLVNGKIRTKTAANVKIGTPIFNYCISVIRWKGFIEIDQEPSLIRSRDVIDFRVVDSRIYSRKSTSHDIAGTIWRWIKKYVHPRFNRLRVDLTPLTKELKELLRLVFPEGRRGIDRLLDSVAIVRTDIIDKRIELGIRLDVDELSSDPVSHPEYAAEPALTEAELARWEQLWQHWDAFLTHVIKHVGGNAVAEELHAALLAVLLNARQDILEIMVPENNQTTDPVPGLFVKTWKQLAPELRRLSENLPLSSTLNYLSFISAGDALVAIQETERQTGFVLSADALRHMVRMLIPAQREDPLIFTDAVDPEIRSIFGFGDPIFLSQEYTGFPPATAIRLIGGMQVTAMLFMPVMLVPDSNYQTLVQRLNGWVPTRQLLDEYLPVVHQLLEQVTQSKLVEKNMDKQYHELFKGLVLSTAWQESCWRQFIQEKGEVKPIGSHAGAIGIMQINQHVWRGFYDVDSLKQDVGYNARAGSEILYHYLVDYAIARGEHERAGGMDNLPRATYAMYNGGPRQMNRYRNEKTSKSLRRIDDAFWNKYQIVSGGDIMGVAECFAG